MVSNMSLWFNTRDTIFDTVNQFASFDFESVGNPFNQPGLFHGFGEPEDTFSDMLVDAAVDQWWDRKHQMTHNMLMDAKLRTSILTEDPITGERLNDLPPTGPVDWEAISNTKTGIDSIDSIDMQGSDGFNDDFHTLDEMRGWTLLSFGRDLTEDEISAWYKRHNL